MVEPHPRYVCNLATAGAELAEVGGKGESLVRLAAAGFPVPPGFVVTTAGYRRFVSEHGLTGRGDQFGAYPIPADLAEPILAAYAELGSPPVAVRSSATAEDLPGLSFAGQQDSFLNVRGEDDLLDAVRRCWASLWTDRAVAYRAREGISEVDLSLAVVVQQLVPAEAAGVMFTADPITGDDSVLLIDAAWGLGEAVVSGQVTPDSFAVTRSDGAITRRLIHPKTTMTVRTATGTENVPVPADQQDLPSLTDDQVRRLAQLGGTIAADYDRPMDIEWCRQGEELFVVQARPITTTPATPEPPADQPAPLDPWNDSRRGDFLWTNTNVGEAIPDVMTPATWSMVQVFLADAMATASIPPYIGYGRIGGRIYLNVSVMARLSATVGVNERRFRNLTEEVFGRLPEDLDIPPVAASRVAVLLGVVPMAWHVVGEARRDMKVLDAYLDDHPRRCRVRRAEIAAVTSPRRLAQLWEGTLDPEFNRASWMLSAATRSSGATFVATRKRLQRLVGDAGANALTAGLSSSAGQLASLGLLEGLDRVARGEIDRATFNETYGHRGPHEFEISTPRPGEDPDWIDAQLAERPSTRPGADSPPSYADLLARQERARQVAWADLERRHPVQAKVLRRQLARWAKISRDREHARSEVIRYFWVLRAYALRAGQLTGLGEQIFFCEAAEIVRALNGETISPAVLAERQQAYAGYLTLPAYPGLIRGRFDPFAWADDPYRRSDLYVQGATGQAGTTASNTANDTVRGFPGSAGVVVGRVRLITDPSRSAEFQPGEVLVTTVTNVGWTPLFPRAAAVVTDVGAPLSHAAIVAREIGIPAVVGCGNATMRLRTGDRVRVDGTAGTVEVLADEQVSAA